MISVDAFDLRILGALQDDGRLTNQQLADIAGLNTEERYKFCWGNAIDAYGLERIGIRP